MAQNNISHINDEILIRDEEGLLKKLKGSDISDFKSFSDVSSQQPKEKKTLKKDSFSFDEEDKAEIENIKKNLVKSSGLDFDYEKEAEEIIKKSKISFSSDEATNRFKNIVIFRLKDIRDQIETKSTLLKPQRSGGLGLKIGKADSISEMIEEKFRALNEQAQKKVSMDDTNEFIPQTTPQTEISQKPKLIYQPSGRPSLENIEYKSKLVGPLEELENLNLTDFRRLAKNPREATEKIGDKIKILQEESFSQGLKAIKAWHKSDLNKLYLAMGEQAIEETADLETVKAKRKQAGEEYLSLEEFKALMDFNKKLRE